METVKTLASKEVQAGSNLPAKVEEAKPSEQAKTPKGAIELSAASFSTYFTWRGSGNVRLNCSDGRITANSRVFASAGEYNTDPRQNRFVGNANMSVLNVAPTMAGSSFCCRLTGGPINVRVDFLVDPS